MKQLLCVLLLVPLFFSCAGLSSMSSMSPKDQAIEYRAVFNSALSQFNVHIQTVPDADKEAWKARAIPIARAAAVALHTFDVVAAGGGSFTPESVQEFLTLKNQLIDLTAELILKNK